MEIKNQEQFDAMLATLRKTKAFNQGITGLMLDSMATLMAAEVLLGNEDPFSPVLGELRLNILLSIPISSNEPGKTREYIKQEVINLAKHHTDVFITNNISKIKEGEIVKYNFGGNKDGN